MRVPAWAHHAFGAEFDIDKPIKLTGTLTKVEWINPHAWLHIDVEEHPDGTVTDWMVEGGSLEYIAAAWVHPEYAGSRDRHHRVGVSGQGWKQ